MNKLTALATHLEIDKAEISIWNDYFTHGDREYLVLTDRERKKKAREYILENLWTFNPSFILDHRGVDLTERDREIVIKSLEELSGKMYESLTPLIAIMIKSKSKFVNDAIEADGYGHFLANYDGNEHEIGNYFIYRVN